MVTSHCNFTPVIYCLIDQVDSNSDICRVISLVIVVAVQGQINDAGIKDYIDVFIDTEK